MSAIPITRDISPLFDEGFSGGLPHINTPITAAYKEVFLLLESWNPSTDPEQKKYLHKKVNETFHTLKLYSFKKLPQIWRKEIYYLNTWVLKKSFDNIIESISAGLKQIKELEEHLLASIEQEEIPQSLDTSDSYPIAEEVPFNAAYILTGRVKRIPLEGASDELRRNLKLGEEMIRHARECIPYSTNHLKRNPLIQLITNAPKHTHLLETVKKIDYVIKKTHEVIRKSRSNHLLQIKPFNNALTKTSGIGNCEEMAIFAYYYEKMSGTELEMNLVKIKDGDHAFIVIDPSSEDAVFCDPWSGSCFPGSVAHLYLRNYVRDLNPPPFCTTVEAVDPSRVKIRDHHKYYYLNSAFVKAGKVEQVKMLLETIPEYTQDEEIYQELVEIAFDAGHFDVLTLLLEKGNPQTLTPLLRGEISQETISAQLQYTINSVTADAIHSYL